MPKNLLLHKNSHTLQDLTPVAGCTGFILYLPQRNSSQRFQCMLAQTVELSQLFSALTV